MVHHALTPLTRSRQSDQQFSQSHLADPVNVQRRPQGAGSKDVYANIQGGQECLVPAEQESRGRKHIPQTEDIAEQREKKISEATGKGVG